jgi:hypothetical protein
MHVLPAPEAEQPGRSSYPFEISIRTCVLGCEPVTCVAPTVGEYMYDVGGRFPVLTYILRLLTALKM